MTSYTGFRGRPAAEDTSVLSYAFAAAVTLVALVACYLAARVLWHELDSDYANERKTSEQLKQEFSDFSASERNSLLGELRTRLSAEQLDRLALSKTATLLELSGENKDSDQLALLTAQRSLRDVNAQEKALSILLKEGDIEKSLYIMDGLIRSRPVVAETLFDLILKLSTSLEGEKALSKLLASNPPWRPGFFARAAAGNTDAQQIYRLLTALKASQSPPNDFEARLLISKMIASKSYTQAYYVWLDMLPPGSLEYVGRVFDGGFEGQSRNLYFDWTFNRTKTVEVRVVPRATGSTDQVLRVDYIGNRQHAVPVSQYVRLDPGNYVFSGDQSSDSLNAQGGINWQISCLEGEGGVLARSPKLNGSTQWSRFEVRLTVPNGCSTQLLTLLSASSATLDQQISGMASFDNIAMTANP